MNPAPRPETGSLLIVQRIEDQGPIAVELPCGCVLVYQRWLGRPEAPPLRVSDILVVDDAGVGGVSARPSIGGADIAIEWRYADSQAERLPASPRSSSASTWM
jgi:hypothetical protein